MTDAPEVEFAEHPARKCREPQSEDGFNYHFCDLAQYHPGPHCPKTLRAAIKRRQEWEKDNPGWRSLVSHDDPFKEIRP